MSRFVALLRGVNVGGNNRVPMADLRTILEDLGFTGVRTLLNSGNAVFESAGRSTGGHSKKIAAALLETLDVDVMVIVKSDRDIEAVLDENTLVEHGVDHSKLLVAFVAEQSSLRELSSIEKLVEPPEEIFAGNHALYLHLANGIHTSKVAKALLGKAGRVATTRNWATVLKLAQMLRDESVRS